jgi:hypothetical protein
VDVHVHLAGAEIQPQKRRGVASFREEVSVGPGYGRGMEETPSGPGRGSPREVLDALGFEAREDLAGPVRDLGREARELRDVDAVGG